MKDSHLNLTDGRRLAFTDIGDAGWPCVFFFHGAPMSRLHLAYLEPEFIAAGVRAVSPDRPGYGNSSPLRDRSMADWPHDVAALADALGIGRFIAAGHSSGGPYSVACAALLADRVVAAITLGGVTDMAWSGAWDGYLESESELMRVGDEDAAIAWSADRFGADGAAFHSASGLEFAEPDNSLFADAAAGPAITAAVVEAMRQGVIGYALDMVVQGRPWPFDPAGITVPVHVLHGERDVLGPLAHSRHTSELIPPSTLRVLPGHGHMTIVSELPALASALTG